VIFKDLRESYALTIFPPEDGQWLTFDLAEARRVLLQAKESLVARGYPDLSV
jgi:hypothetical protein